MSYRSDVRNYIIEHGVCKKQTITYEELEQQFHLARGGHKKSKSRVGDVVGNISEFEYANNRPYLSAIVVHKSGVDKGYPGGGFLGLPGIHPNFARKGGYVKPLTNPEKSYIQQEQAKVFAYPYPCD